MGLLDVLSEGAKLLGKGALYAGTEFYRGVSGHEEYFAQLRKMDIDGIVSAASSCEENWQFSACAEVLEKDKGLSRKEVDDMLVEVHKQWSENRKIAEEMKREREREMAQRERDSMPDD